MQRQDCMQDVCAGVKRRGKRADLWSGRRADHMPTDGTMHVLDQGGCWWAYKSMFGWCGHSTISGVCGVWVPRTRMPRLYYTHLSFCSAAAALPVSLQASTTS